MLNPIPTLQFSRITRHQYSNNTKCTKRQPRSILMASKEIHKKPWNHKSCQKPSKRCYCFRSFQSNQTSMGPQTSKGHSDLRCINAYLSSSTQSPHRRPTPRFRQRSLIHHKPPVMVQCYKIFIKWSSTFNACLNRPLNST